MVEILQKMNNFNDINENNEQIINLEINDDIQKIAPIKKFEVLFNRYKVIVNNICELTNELRLVSKKINKFGKVSGKKIKVPRTDKKPRIISGFAKATKVPLKIAELIGVSQDELYPRPSVTSKIFQYVKTKNLDSGITEEQKKGLQKGFKLDSVLKKIFNTNEDYVTFKIFQKLLANCYKEDQNKNNSVKDEQIKENNDVNKVNTIELTNNNQNVENNTEKKKTKKKTK